MYCQQRLIAVLYAILRPYCNETQQSLRSIPYEYSTDQDHGLKCTESPSNGLDDFAVVDIYSEGPQCSKLDELICRTPGDNFEPSKQHEKLLCFPRIIQDVSIPEFHSEPNNLQRKHHIYDSNGRSPKTKYSTQRYSEIAGYLISTVQHQMIYTKPENPHLREMLEFETGSNRSIHSNEIEGNNARGNPHSRHRKSVIPQVERDICTIFFPQENGVVVESHCTKQRERKLQAFYSVRALLGFSIVGAALLYLLCETYKRLEMRHLFFSKAVAPQHPRAQSRFSALHQPDSMWAQVPGLFSFRARIDSLPKEEENARTDDAESMPSTFSTSQWSFSKLRLLSRGPRKRIQDAFDLESLNSKHVEDGKPGDRVLVLPRAPNASIRRHFIGVKSKGIQMEPTKTTSRTQLFI